MLEILKENDGLTWNQTKRLFTSNTFQDGYEIISVTQIHIELDNQIYLLDSTSVLINNEQPTDAYDMINKIFAI